MTLPIQYPTWPPSDGGDRDEDQQLPEREVGLDGGPCAAVPAANMPATNSSVSPGSTGNNTPDSTNMTAEQADQCPGAEVADELDRVHEVRHQHHGGLVMAHQDTGAG